MRKHPIVHVIAAAVASACLASPALAAEKTGRYMILAPQSVQAKARSAAGILRESVVQTSQNVTAAAVQRAGAAVDKQLTRVAPISFAELSDSQVKSLRAQGYQVAPVGVKHLLEGPRINADTIPYGIAKVRAPESWSRTTGAGRKVCVIDTGIDYNHPDLAGNFVEGISTVGAGGPDPADVHGHGTHVSGTIAAAMNGSDVVGVAHEASIYSAAVFGASGTATDEDILEGVDWCVGKGVNIFSMSYGGDVSTDVEEAAYQAAYDAGILLVAATGNDGPSVPISFPARYDFVVAVGATDTNDAIASFSQRGPEIDVVAPGVGVVSDARGGGTTTMSGTSMATPHVSGVAAALWAAHPELTNAQVVEILHQTSVDLGAAGFDNTYGYGRVDLKAALDYADTGNLPPAANFTATVMTNDPLSALFTDKSSDPNGDAIVMRQWDFGDGQSSTETRPRHTYAAPGDYSAVLTVTDAQGASRAITKLVKVGPPQAGYLTNGVPVTGLSGGEGSWSKFRLRVPLGATNLRVQLSGGSGDVDLYVRYAAAPTASQYDCRPYAAGNNENCAFDEPSAGIYYIYLSGYEAYSGATLVASYDIAGPSGPSFENTDDYAIPDNNPAGVESPLAVDRTGPSGSVRVKVNIVHTFIGDLVVDLISPAGTVFNLHNRTGGGTDNINTTYTVPVGDEDSAGVWKLRVVDQAALDSGYIDSWKLTFPN